MAAFAAVLAKPLVAAGIQAAGQLIQAGSQASALRRQAGARIEAGERDLAVAGRQVRRDIGQQAVEAAASGLLTTSFTDVFDSQAIEDANFLGSIRQQIEFDVENLRRQKRTALIGGAIGAGTAIIGGFIQKAAQEKALDTASRQARRLSPNTFQGRRGAVGRALTN